MKKNKMLRLASALLVCVLLTTSVISGTFAKYVTQTTKTATARVAKWGITFNATTDLFAQAYKNEAVTDATANTATVKVSGSDTSNLVAPGTNGTGLDISITGDKKPEVSYDVVIRLKESEAGAGDTEKTPKVPTLSYTKDSSSATYEPVKFSICNGDTVLGDDAHKNMNLATLKSVCNGAVVIYEYDVAADKYYINSNLDSTISDEEKAAASAVTTPPQIKIKWSWAFGSDGDTVSDTVSENDVLDTILGDLAANPGADLTLPAGITINKDASNTDVKLDWIVTATQID